MGTRVVSATRNVGITANTSHKRMTVYGYIRSTLDDKRWVEEIIQIILQYYTVKSGSLYMFGNGDGGKLGIEEYENKICKEPTICPQFNNLNALDVSANSHTLILDVYGQVWSCGNGHFGRLGIGKRKHASTPQKLKLRQPAIAVAVGTHHSLILLNNGNVQSFGAADYGPLGHGNSKNPRVPETIAILRNYKITQIAAGHRQSACLSEDGDLFFFGDNEYGQCGFIEEKGKYIGIPTKTELGKKKVFVTCGDKHSLFITSDGCVYSFGFGLHGRLGHGNESNKWSPTLIQRLKHKRMKMCAAGMLHSLCIDDDGIVWAFGRNSNGQCGLGRDVLNQHTPKVIEWFVSNNIKAKECDANSHQSAVISEDDSLYVFGNNDKNQLSSKDSTERNGLNRILTPIKLSLCSVKKVALGRAYTAVIAE